MAPSTSFPEDGAPDNLWTEYARFHEACSGVLDRIERHCDSGLALSESELAELRTMILNLNAFGRLLHGKRGKEMRVLARRANLALGRAGEGSLAEVQEDGEAEDSAATVDG